MKYLFINSVAGVGSTGRIAADKCRELMAQGHECRLAYGRTCANCEDVPTIRIGSDLDFKLHGVMTRIVDNHGFSSAAATRKFLNMVKEYDPDVIWLHNVHGYYIHVGMLFDYLRVCGKKIYWTLHDCWSFTGHCAYFDFVGCDKWKTGCEKCPQKKSYPASMLMDNSMENYASKKYHFAGIPNLTLVVPSQWLADLLQESFLREYPVEVVYNTVDTSIFKPTPGDFRQKYNLEGKTVVLGVANIWEERKGLRDFVTLAKRLDDRFKIVLVGLTKEQLEQLPKEIMGMQRTNSAQELAQLYTTADMLVNPTYEDNYPTVNLEARACGTRVITYDTGGCAETLGEKDILIPKGDVNKLTETIIQIQRGIV